MKRKILHSLLICSLVLLAGLGTAVAQTTVSGKVIDQDKFPLIGANVVIQGTTDGTVTDFDGNFEYTFDRDAPFTLEISYVGSDPKLLEVTGDATGLTIVLSSGLQILNDVVISASRKREKVQEAPASISVLNPTQIASSGGEINPVRSLVNTPGVQLSQQSASRINIEMRASVGLFGTSVFPIMDYRSLVGPGIGTFQSDASGLSNIDLARIEVVRGPGSALYGPGVTSGVVHFITKSPIDEPGTTIQLGGGELATFVSAVRHATKVSDKFGFKINANYNRGNEFVLDGSEGTFNADSSVFTRQIDKFQTTIIQPATTNGVVDLTQPGQMLLQLDTNDIGNPMQDFWWNYTINTTLEFRPQDDLSFNVSGGVNEASAIFYNDLGEGLTQAREWWSQARMQWKGLFVQAFYLNNNGGNQNKPTFLYQTGNRSPVGRQQVEAQAQYNFGIPKALDADITVGVDYRRAINETFNLVYGRNENDDAYRIFGGYAQAKFALIDELDLLVAGRYDVFNFIDDGFFSPRVALVYKPDPRHTFRASFNRSGSAPTGLEWNIDFPVNAPIPGVFDFWLAGQREIQTFDDPTIEFLNPNFIAAAAGLDPTDPAIAGIIANLPSYDFGQQGLGLDFPYALLNPQVVPGIVAALMADPQTAPLASTIEAYLLNPANTPSGTTGTFFGVNAFDGNRPLNALIPTTRGVIRTSNTFEIGYKGLIADKLSVSIDIYNTSSKGFSDFTQIAPLITLLQPNLANDLGAEVGAGLTAFLIENGIPEANAAALGANVGGGYTLAAQLSGLDALLPAFYGTGTVESNRMPQDDGILHVAAGYRIFPDAELNYWGTDIGLQYYFRNDLSAFANYSWVSETQFGPEELGEPADSPLAFSLNTPQNKFRLGLIYAPLTGFRSTLSFQHDDSFLSNTGQYSGNTDVKNLVDLSVGYAFTGNFEGLAIDVSGTNIFDTEFRAFPNMPLIGRRVIGKLTYTFGNKKE